MKNLVQIVALALAATGASADYSVKGEGNFSCPEYISARRSNDAKLYSSISWVQGFITGVNYQRALEEGAHSLTGRDFPAVSMVRWLENYCQENLVDDLADAAVALVLELSENEKPRP